MAHAHNRDAILILGPPHISGSNWERKLKFGMWIDMHRSFNIGDNFLR